MVVTGLGRTTAGRAFRSLSNHTFKEVTLAPQTTTTTIRGLFVPAFVTVQQSRCLSSSSSSIGNTLFPDIRPRIILSPPNDDEAGGRRHNKKNKKKHNGKPSYRFVDKIRVRVAGGDGGKGSLSLHRIGRKRKVRPDGGHGGDGGSVIVFADPNEQSLRMSNPHVRASNGTNGSSQEKYGRRGKNKIIRVPCGVVVKRVLDYDEVWDPETKQVTKLERAQDQRLNAYDYDDNDDSDGETDNGDDESLDYYLNDMIGSSDLDVFVEGRYSYDDDDDENDLLYQEFGDREKVVLADLEKPGDHVVVARGGKGGSGSSLFASLHGGLPDAKILSRNARPDPGEVAFLELELKLIADIGLVGFPNAGKSSLLCAMSRAGPQVAPYPFTTLNPFVGVVEYGDGFRLRAADIPGLIDGASEGRGKGHDFLRHLERTKALLYIVDAAGTDGRKPVDDLKILANELLSYGDGDMINRHALVVANKLDLLEEGDETEEVLSNLAAAAAEMDIRIYGDVLGISAGVTGLGLRGLSQAMRNIVLESTYDG